MAKYKVAVLDGMLTYKSEIVKAKSKTDAVNQVIRKLSNLKPKFEYFVYKEDTLISEMCIDIPKHCTGEHYMIGQHPIWVFSWKK